MRCDDASALTTWRRPISKVSVESCGAVGAVAERHPVELRVDVDLGAGRVVLAGAPVRPRTANLVGQPRPAALDRRIGGDLERLLDRGLVADRRVELQDDRRRDADDLTVGELELAVDLGFGVDGGEVALHRNGLAVAADHRAGPAVDDAVAEWLGGVECGAVAVEGARDDLALGIGQGDPLEPAVLDLETDRRSRGHIGGCVGRLECQRRSRGRGCFTGCFAGPAGTGGQCARRDDADRERGKRPPSVDRRHWIGWAHVDPAIPRARTRSATARV